jgi:hypothetical protein
MIALYPSYPGQPRVPDAWFQEEAKAAKQAGFKTALVDIELQLGGDVILRMLPEDDHEVVYRGWILKPEVYDRLEETLRVTGWNLVESPEAYRETYEFPRWYKKLEEETPRSIVIPKEEGKLFDLDAVAELVYQAFQTRLSLKDQARVAAYDESFRAPDGSPIYHTGHLLPELMELPGARPVILKDWIKSRKENWFQACFIPDARDHDYVKRVTQCFIDLMEMADLAGGLVFRQFEEFRRIGTHPRTHMPVINEWRGFLVNGTCCYLAPYWSSGDYTNVDAPDPNWLEALGRQANLISAFYTIDVAQKLDGPWRVIEIGSGGASGVPEGGGITTFYQNLAEALG